MNRILSTIGICSSLAYGLLTYFFLQSRLTQLHTLPINEVGDFFAGIFGPLAILWLVLGFFQQGIEVRLNTKALELQAEELKNSVEQQRELVEVTRKQLEADIETIRYERQKEINAARPKFISSGTGGVHRGDGKSTFSCSITNIGNMATEVKIVPSIKLRKFTLTNVPSWPRDIPKPLEWEYESWVPELGLKVSIFYLDVLGAEGEQQFEFIPDLKEPHPSVIIRKLDA